MTYGEAYTIVKFSLRMEKGRWVHDPKPQHEVQMCREDAAFYYTNKFREYFGLELKAEPSSFGTLKFIVPRKIRKGLTPELTLKDFDSAEDYFGYFEALKITQELKIAC